jgi:Ca-activated chloride channel family protein
MNDGGLSQFEFANPWWLLLLLLLPILAVLKGRLGGTAGVVFSSTAPMAALGKRRRSRAGALLALLAHLALAAFIVGLARPQLGRTLTHVQASGVDIMLALDVSGSMLAEDFSIGSQRANRIEAVKQVTEQFIRQRPNDRIGIVAFAGRPYLVSPLTLDHDWLIQNLDRLQVGLIEDGTAIGSAMAAAANRLKDQPAKTKLIVLLSDGDNNSGRVTPLTAAEAAKVLNIRTYSIGTGTQDGEVPFPFQDPFGRTVYQNVAMAFNEDTLKQIASITNGKYFRAADTASLKRTFSDIDKMEKTKIEVERTAEYRDLFGWFLMAGFTLLGAEVLLSQTAWKRLP